MTSFFSRAVLGAALLFCVPFVRADETAKNLRFVGQKYGAALVTIELSITTSATSDPLELTTVGAVIDSSGLIALSYTAVDPYSMVPSGEEQVSNVKSARVLLAGREIPARVVLRDKDRNLAFLRPLSPLAVTPLPFAASAQKAKTISVAPGDAVALLGRLGKAGNREVSVEPGRINAVLTRPRSLYLLPAGMFSHLGEVAFSEKGELLGLVGIRVLPSSSRSRTIDRSDAMVPVITPAAEVWAFSRKAPPLKK